MDLPAAIKGLFLDAKMAPHGWCFFINKGTVSPVYPMQLIRRTSVFCLVGLGLSLVYYFFQLIVYKFCKRYYWDYGSYPGGICQNVRSF
jgi:hypothetical protein